MSPPATIPRPRAAAMIPHAAAPPRDSLATIGPSVWKGATTANRIVVAQTITQSHVQETSSRQPPASSATKLSRTRSRTGQGMRSSASDAALTANVAASTAKTHPGLATATTAPATAGPMTNALLVSGPAWRWPAAAAGGSPSPGRPRGGRLEERLGRPVNGDQGHQARLGRPRREGSPTSPGRRSE